MLDGVNAAVVGLLAAVLINPIMMTAITSPAEAVIALAGFFFCCAAGCRRLLLSARLSRQQ